MSIPLIRLEPGTGTEEEGVGSIVLSNPPLNLFAGDALEQLAGVLDQLEGSDLRVAVWRAEGELFSGGADVNAFQQIVDGHRDGDAGQFSEGLIELVRRVAALPMPTLALCHGLCLTLGFEIALACDMIWASESARFGLVEAVVGLAPGAGGTQRLVERAGTARALELVMTGGLYDAATLNRWNVLNRVVQDDELQEKGMLFARQLARGPTRAHAGTKRVVQAYLRGGIDEADRLMPEIFKELFATEDVQSGVRSFLTDGPGKATFNAR